MTNQFQLMPSMSPEDVEALIRNGPCGDGTLWASCDPNEITYGTPLQELAANGGCLNDLIEFAAPAGQIGYCDTGIRLLLRGAHLIACAEASAEIAAGVTADALGSLDATPLFDVLVLVEEQVADLEERTAALLEQESLDEASELACHLSSERAAAALERAARARDRAVALRAEKERSAFRKERER
jgi:hypothetical protein